MSDLIERLEVAAQWDDSPSSLIHEAIARIADLEAQLAALSRTGAVKVKALQFHLAQLRHAYAHLKAGGVVDQSSFADGLISPASAAIETALSALEPAAPEPKPEGDDERIRREMDEVLRKQSERDIPFAPATRPAEQAVTEKMVQAAARSDALFDGRGDLDTLGRIDRDRYMERARRALKAAMEAKTTENQK